MFHKKHYIPVFIYYYEITVLQLDQMGSSIQGNAMFLYVLCAMRQSLPALSLIML